MLTIVTLTNDKNKPANNCNREEAIKYARTSGNRHGWEKLCVRKDVSPEEAILFIKESGYWILWFDLLARADVLDFLKNLSPKEAIVFGNKVNYAEVWKILLAREDIPAADAIAAAKNIPLSYEKLPVTDWRNSDPSIWGIILRRTDIPINDAISYAKEFSDIRALDLWKGIVSRKDISFSDAVKYANRFYNLNKDKHTSIWKYIITRDDALLAEIIKYARIFDFQPLWVALVERKDISPEDAMALANESKDHHVISCAKRRPDVMNYLRPNKK